MSFTCETCYDTETIDQGGREISCPDCVAHYHPSSVRVQSIEAGVEFRPGYTTQKAGWIVWDGSVQVGGVYGVYNTSVDAERAARTRRGVIKAALTRRANKARRNALKGA